MLNASFAMQFFSGIERFQIIGNELSGYGTELELGVALVSILHYTVLTSKKI